HKKRGQKTSFLFRVAGAGDWPSASPLRNLLVIIWINNWA
ncbi:MAG: hypothetical protein ACI9IP_000001, partial [Arcticibacterium sp.]